MYTVRAQCLPSKPGPLGNMNLMVLVVIKGPSHVMPFIGGRGAIDMQWDVHIACWMFMLFNGLTKNSGN